MKHLHSISCIQPKHPQAGFALPMVMAWLMLAAWLGHEALQQVWLDARLQTSAWVQTQSHSMLQSAMARARHDALNRLIDDMPGWWQRLHDLPSTALWESACLEGVCAADRVPPVPSPWHQLSNSHPLWTAPASSTSSPHARHSLWLSQRLNEQQQVIDWHVQAWVMVTEPLSGYTSITIVEVR